MSPELQQQFPSPAVRTVLLAEDDFELRSATAEWLRMSGYQVIEAIDSAEATSVLSSGASVNVVFSDVHMTDSPDGFSLAHWMATHYPQVPVLLTSGGRTEANRAAANGLEFLQKPYDPALLLRKISLMLAAQTKSEPGSSAAY